MWNEPTKKRLAKIPGLYETENVSVRDKKIYLHFFLGAADWYIAEYDGKDMFWGFANLGDDMCAEWGYVSFSELKDINVNGWLEVDCELEEHWQIKKAIEIKEICRAQRWQMDKTAEVSK